MRKVFSDSIVSIIQSKPYLIDVYQQQVDEFLALLKDPSSRPDALITACHRLRGGAAALAGDDVVDAIAVLEKHIEAGQDLKSAAETVHQLTLGHLAELRKLVT